MCNSKTIYMRRYLAILMMAAICVTGAFAQSGMSDQEIMQYVISEHEKGTEQAEIVTKLMQRGVTIDQLRRVRKKMEQEQSSQALGAKNLTTSAQSARLRENNGKPKDNAKQVSP